MFLWNQHADSFVGFCFALEVLELNPRPHTCWSNEINIELTPQLPTCLLIFEFNTEISYTK